MRTAEFDAFVALLQSSVGRAQARISARNQGRLEHLLQLDNEGRTEMIAWSMTVDTEAGDSSGEDTIRLPLVTLRPHLPANISELVVEFEAAIDDVELPAAPVEASVLTGARDPAVRPPRRPPPRSMGARARRRLALLLKPRGWLSHWWLRRRLHRIRIHLSGPQPGGGEVFVDDVLLKSLSPVADAAAIDGTGRP